MTAVKSGIIFKSKLASIGIWPYIVRLHLFEKKNQCYCNPQSDHFLLIPTKNMFETTTKLRQLYYDLFCSAMAVLAWIRQSPDGSSQHYKNYVMRQRDYVSILDWEATRSLIHFQGTKHNCLTPHFPFSRLC